MAAQAGDSIPKTMPVSEEEVRQALGRILASKYFSHAPKKQRFLNLICDAYLNGRAGELNEYLIGREVFDRDDNYSPSSDPIVRVGAHDVRKKLELYYNNEGANDEVRLEIPVGSYEPVFIRQVSQQAGAIIDDVTEPSLPSFPPGATTAPLVSTPPSGDRRALLLATGAIVALAITVAALGVWNYQLQQAQSSPLQSSQQHVIEEYGAVWEPFLTGNEPTLFILSNPPVYRFLNPADPEATVKRSLSLAEEQIRDMERALGDKFITKYTPAPKIALLPEDYTGMGEAIGLYRLTDMFRTAGRTVTLKQSRNVSAEDLKNQHVILLGSAWVNEWSAKPPVKEDFIYTGRATIENTAPGPGEESEYKPVFNPDNGNLITDYALITVKPNISDKYTVMVLAGIHSEGTQAAAEYVTSKEYLKELNSRLRQGREKAPRYYQALLKIGVDNGIPTTISLLSVHELHLQKQ